MSQNLAEWSGTARCTTSVRDEVAKHEIGREDEAPIERQVPARRAVAPLRSLVHHVDPPGPLLGCERSTQVGSPQ